MLECSDGLFYVGVTNDPNRRLEEHNHGINKDSFTFKRRPVKLVYYDYFTNYLQAINWETQLKKWSRKKKLALISHNWEKIHELAICQNDSRFKDMSIDSTPETN